MNILLLGATGLLGHNVLHSLLARGHSVVALVRDGGTLPSDPMLNLLRGSILDVAALRNAASGCDAIINCAGTTDMSLLHYDDYLPVNKVLVEYILQVMDEVKINTLVHVSSANTIGYGTPQSPGVESNDICAPFSASYYAQSKVEGEKILLWDAQ